jgi:hypothetical protein
MEKVFLVLGENLPKETLAGKEYSKISFGLGDAFVEKVLGPKRYLVSLVDGTKLTAIGPAFINKGTKVQISPLSVSVFQKNAEANSRLSPHSGHQYSAFIPLKLRNKTSEAKLELYIEKGKDGFLSKNNPIVYLVFSVKTESYGQVQWSLYLKGKQILIQIYTEKDGAGKNDIHQMIQDFEGSLRKKGFSLLTPTVILKKPFKLPSGFQLNIRG